MTVCKHSALLFARRLALAAMTLGPVALAAAPQALFAQQEKPKPAPKPGPMLAQGRQQFEAAGFRLSLVKSSQTAAELKVGAFDFLPGDKLIERSENGYYHLGDIDVRLRAVGEAQWRGYSTAVDRKPVKALPTGKGEFAAAELNASMAADMPLTIVRRWLVVDGHLALRFELKNTSAKAVEIGSFGMPLVLNNIITERTLDEAHEKCAFSDPYIGGGAGYVQATRLNGAGPALVIAPLGSTPLEAYNPLRNSFEKRPAELFVDRTARNMTFEGFYEWMPLSKAYAENEWKKAEPWNPATSVTLQPGETKSYGLIFLASPTIDAIETTLRAAHKPVAIGAPGYVLPQDIDARLHLDYDAKVKSIAVDPAGAIDVSAASSPDGKLQSYALKGKSFGRARLVVTYADGLEQDIQYFVTKPAAESVANLGHFLTTKQWFEGPDEIFHRSPSVMSYDREKNEIVMQDSRVWVSGLSDEGGSGAWLAAMMKELGQPDKDEITKLERFVDEVLWGSIQFKDGAHKYGVRKSVFYYDPAHMPKDYYDAKLNWRSWTSWKKEDSEDVGRAFNYPHVVAAYWVMYRTAANHPGMVTKHEAGWYLEQAYQTTLAMMEQAPYYTAFGLMEGDVFVQLLDDLKREGRADEAAKLEALMRGRAEQWRKEAYPFGSEMPWDSTGQEEVYAWTRRFGYADKAQVTLNAILGYTPTIPHWGYNGSARRYWDFLYGGKYSRIERQLHHYGSGINAIPILAAYRDNPTNLRWLRAGFAGSMGAIADIDSEGFLSPAFHSWPDMLKFDPLSGDNGPNFFGHALNAATYVAHDERLGWVCFGGNLRESEGVVAIEPRDSFRERLYIAPAGLWITLDAGKIASALYDVKAQTVKLTFAAGDFYTPQALVRVEQPAKIAGVGDFQSVGEYKTLRGGYVVALDANGATLELKASPAK